MSFGKRRFTQLVYQQGEQDGQTVGWYMARFVPLDFGAHDEVLTEEDLRREVDDNARSAAPLPDQEEQLALRAFVAQARNKSFSRAAVESVQARGQQRTIVDVCDAGERATIERWRRGVLMSDRADWHKNTIATFNDIERQVLALLDKYLPSAKGK